MDFVMRGKRHNCADWNPMRTAFDRRYFSLSDPLFEFMDSRTTVSDSLGNSFRPVLPSFLRLIDDFNIYPYSGIRYTNSSCRMDAYADLKINLRYQLAQLRVFITHSDILSKELNELRCVIRDCENILAMLRAMLRAMPRHGHVYTDWDTTRTTFERRYYSFSDPPYEFMDNRSSLSESLGNPFWPLLPSFLRLIDDLNFNPYSRIRHINSSRRMDAYAELKTNLRYELARLQDFTTHLDISSTELSELRCVVRDCKNVIALLRAMLRAMSRHH